MTASTRRTLLAGSIGASIIFPPLAKGAQAQTRVEAMSSAPAPDRLAGRARRIMVESEFAPLRTVVLAQSQMRLPDANTMTPEQIAAESAILPAAHRDLLLSLLGKDHAQAMPERQRKWEAERAAFQQVLERYGVEVLHPRLLTDFEKQAGGSNGYSNSYVRDPWFTVGNTVIEGSLRFPHRRREVLPSRDIFKQDVLPAACGYVALPQPEVFPLEVDDGGPGPFLEGGDVLVYGRHVFVGNSGRASTALGAAFLQKLLAPQGYSVEIVRLKPNILHLDCALGLVREGLCVVHEDGLLDGIPESLRDWDRIPASETESMQLGTNGLPISPEVYVTDPVFHRIGDEVAKQGIKVEYVDFEISRGFGGAFRCSTQPLHRE